jgi:aspartyl-tRNA(Asn)/glutamyl-tRNA(Gln) amidotransferase subunit B
MEIKTIVGLEIHVQLKTETKMFCSCSAKYFEDDANTHLCPVCLGLPGSLPVMNKSAIVQAIKAGKALNFTINLKSRFDRKNYMYPDLFKGYQITQFEFPIDTDGHVVLSSGKRINIYRAHIEEDTAKSIHDKEYTLLDGNKAGVPLLEIVSSPELFSKEEAKEYAKKIYNTLRFIGVSDCDMEKGQMRFDVNVNLEITKNGNLYKTPICEVKNLNSFRSMERAIEYESKRQLDEFEENGIVLAKGNKTTRGWNDNLSKTFFQRDKEESDDYRYFPEPDLPPLILSEAFIKDAISSIDILPTDAYNSLINKYSLSKDIAELIIEERDYYDFFMSTSLKYKNYINLSNWITTEILGIIKEHSLNISDIDKYTLIKILESIDKKIISVSSGKEILRSVILDKTNVDILIEKNSISSDSGKVDSIINKVLVSHKDTVEKYLEGKEGVLGFLIGQVVREMDGRVDPKDVREKILVVINKIYKN